MSSHSLHDFVFRGLMCDRLLLELEHVGRIRPKDAGRSEQEEVDALAAVEPAVKARARYMMDVYFVLFVFENLIRHFIEQRLEELHGEDWFDETALSRTKQKREQRRKSEESNQWHQGRSAGPLYYVDFGDLSSIITNNWNDFSDLLPSQAWVQARIDEAERSRNVIAHTNVLPEEEAARLKQHLRDWVRQVG